MSIKVRLVSRDGKYMTMRDSNGLPLGKHESNLLVNQRVSTYKSCPTASTVLMPKQSRMSTTSAAIRFNR